MIEGIKKHPALNENIKQDVLIFIPSRRNYN